MVPSLSRRHNFPGQYHKLYAKEWVVYAKRPFGGAQQVYRYLGLYTHRIGIANSRLQAIDERGVRFSTKDGGSATLPPHEFIRRYLLQVLPAAFVEIRHYGLLAAANVNTKLARARCLLGAPAATPRSKQAPITWADWVRLLTGQDLTRCPRCGVGTLMRVPLRRVHRHRPALEASREPSSAYCLRQSTAQVYPLDEVRPQVTPVRPGPHPSRNVSPALLDCLPPPFASAACPAGRPTPPNLPIATAS